MSFSKIVIHFFNLIDGLQALFFSVKEFLLYDIDDFFFWASDFDIIYFYHFDNRVSDLYFLDEKIIQFVDMVGQGDHLHFEYTEILELEKDVN